MLASSTAPSASCRCAGFALAVFSRCATVVPSRIGYCVSGSAGGRWIGCPGIGEDRELRR
jgi:hypothetical protein